MDAKSETALNDYFYLPGKVKPVPAMKCESSGSIDLGAVTLAKKALAVSA